MRFAKAAVFAVSAIALGIGSAYAADKDKDPGFNALDKNNDGYISQAEAQGNPELAKKFKQADKNNDGKLNRAEYLAVMTVKDAKNVKNKVSNAMNKEKQPSSSTGTSAPATGSGSTPEKNSSAQ